MREERKGKLSTILVHVEMTAEWIPALSLPSAVRKYLPTYNLVRLYIGR